MEAFIRVITQDIGIISFLGTCGLVALFVLAFKNGNKKNNNGSSSN